MPGVQRGPRREDHLPFHRVAAVALRELGSALPPIAVIEFIKWSVSFGDVEFPARRLLRFVVFGDAVQHVLQHGQRRLGALEFVGGRGIRSGGKSAGMRPRYDAHTHIVARDEDARSGRRRRR